MNRDQIIIVGAGIAGVSLAAKAAEAGAKVTILEQYGEFPYGATSRSAALFAKSYFCSRAFAILTAASEEAYKDNLGCSASDALLAPRGAIYVGRRADVRDLRDQYEVIHAEGVLVDFLDPTEVQTLVPAINPKSVAAAFIERDAADIDVAALYHIYLTRARAAGAVIMPSAEVLAGRREGPAWHIRTAVGDFEAGTVVNAAGAWGDIVAQRCGILPVGLSALKRTAGIATTVPQGGCDLPLSMPFIFNVGSKRFYWKYTAGSILFSLGEEVVCAPSDAQPDAEDVARVLYDLERQISVRISPTRPRSWAGLRTFAVDRRPTIGFDSDGPGFFWLCGQGGYGIQSAEACASLSKGLLLENRVPAHLARRGLLRGDFCVERFSRSERYARKRSELRRLAS